MRKKWSREAFEKEFGSVEWSQNKNTPEAKEYERMSSQYSTYMEIQNGIPVLRFSCFDPWKDWMGAAFSTRLGGVSEGYLSSMNFGWKQGDDLENVKENYRLFAGAIGVSADDYVFSDQVHDTKVVSVTKEHTAGPELHRKLQGIDGLITAEENVVLATSYADCVPLFIVDPKHRIVAASHSGWRGTVGQIGRKTIEMMVQQYGSDPKDMACVIGPSICQQCYEVSEEVVSALSCVYAEDQMRQIAEPGREPGKYQLDLWAACYETLKEAGVPPKSIQVSGVCTCCHKDLLFSHRATAGKRGNLNGFIWKKCS